MASGGDQVPEGKVIGTSTRMASSAAWARLGAMVAM